MKVMTPVLLLPVVMGGLSLLTADRPPEWRAGTPQHDVNADLLIVTIPIHNQGSTNLSIDRVQPGCRCTTAKISNTVVQPGSTSSIRLMVNLNRLPDGKGFEAVRTGQRRFDVTARVHGNFTTTLPQGFLELRIPCQVVLPVSVPEYLRFQPLNLVRDRSSQQFSMNVHRDVREFDVESETPGVSIRRVTSTVDSHRKSADTWQPVGFIADFDHQQLTASGKGRPQVNIRLNVTVDDAPSGMQGAVQVPGAVSIRRPVQMDPAHLHLGPAKPGEMVSRKALLRSSDAVRSLTVVVPEKPTSADCSVKTEAVGKAESELIVSAAAEITGSHVIRLDARTVLKSGQTVDVPLYVTLHVRKGAP